MVTINAENQPVQWQPFSLCSAAPSLAVVRLQVSRFEPYVQHLLTYLSEDEKRRQARFARPADRSRYAIGRGGLRSLMGHFMGQKPEAITFESSPGKPKVVNDTGPAFNLSHSGDWIVYAFDASPVGIDVEWVNTNLDYNDIVRYHFAPEEQRFVQQHGSDGFYTLWTRKEALVKALGHGIDDNLMAVPSLAGRYPFSLPQCDTNSWAVQSFLCSAGYPATLAYQRQQENRTISFYEVNETFVHP